MKSISGGTESGVRVLIIGAGIGGITFAINLKRRLNFQQFNIYEKGPDIGGTWRDNRYPGCSSDIPIHFYSLSTDLKADWESTHGSQEEIQQYWVDLTRKYNIYPHCVFNTRVVSAVWDDSRQLYCITTENVLTGDKSEAEAEILISAIGILEIPKLPDIRGIDTFKGDMFHSARWREDVKLVGKRVGVIGNGASATQFVPIISKDPSVQVTEFCRTPCWVLPPIRKPFGSAMLWAFANLPLFMRLYRFSCYLQSEQLYLVFGNSFVRWLATKWSTRYILRTAPKKYHDKLLPSYPLGCKRILLDTGYLKALHRPNLTLNWDGIAEIVEDGVITSKGDKIPLDVLICSTGFGTDYYPLPISGRNGQTIQEYYDIHAAPRAYLGTTLPGFPNLYLVSGPNTATGHTSVIYSEEVQIDYCMPMIEPVLQGKASSFEVTHEATDAYNVKIQARLSKSVFVHCVSWYRKDGTGLISNIFPGPPWQFWWWLRKPDWSHYKVVNGVQWIAERRKKDVIAKLGRTLGILTVVAVAIYLRGSTVSYRLLSK